MFLAGTGIGVRHLPHTKYSRYKLTPLPTIMEVKLPYLETAD